MFKLFSASGYEPTDNELIRMIEYVRIRNAGISFETDKLVESGAVNEESKDDFSTIMACFEYLELQKAQWEIESKQEFDRYRYKFLKQLIDYKQENLVLV